METERKYVAMENRGAFLVHVENIETRDYCNSYRDTLSAAADANTRRLSGSGDVSKACAVFFLACVYICFTSIHWKIRETWGMKQTQKEGVGKKK